MRGQGLAPGDDRRLDRDWLPVVGEIVCVHVGHMDPYLAQVIDRTAEDFPNDVRFYILPVGAGLGMTRVYLARVFEPTMATFEGPVCLRCRKGNIR